MREMGVALLEGEWVGLAAFWYIVFLVVASAVLSVVLDIKKPQNVFENLLLYSLIALLVVGLIWAGLSYIFRQLVSLLGL